MFASIYHARVFLCVYINSRKIASVCSAQAQADSSHDRFARWFFRLGAEYTLRGGGGGGEFTVDRHGGCRGREEEESASRTRLFHAYFILHGIASVLRHSREAAVPFSKTRRRKEGRLYPLCSRISLPSSKCGTKNLEDRAFFFEKGKNFSSS